MLAPDATSVIEQLTHQLNVQHQLKLQVQSLDQLYLCPWTPEVRTTLKVLQQNLLPRVSSITTEFSELALRAFVDYTVLLERSLKVMRPLVQQVVAYQGGKPTPEQQQLLIDEVGKLQQLSEHHAHKGQQLRGKFRDLLGPTRHQFDELCQTLDGLLLEHPQERAKVEQLQIQLQGWMEGLIHQSQLATPQTVQSRCALQGTTLMLQFQHEDPLPAYGQTVGQFGINVLQLVRPSIGSLDLLATSGPPALQQGLQGLTLDQQLLVISQGVRVNLLELLRLLKSAEEHHAALSYLWHINSGMLGCLLDTLRQPSIRVQTIKWLHSLLIASPIWQRICEFAHQVKGLPETADAVLALPPILVEPATGWSVPTTDFN